MGSSGSISLEDVAGYWLVAATGTKQENGFKGVSQDQLRLATVMAYITVAESGSNPGAIQQGQPYATTGWGLWQITPGNSESQVNAIDYQLLDPFANAQAAVTKFRGQGITAWKADIEDGTVAKGEAAPLLVPTTWATLALGEWEPSGKAPPGTHNKSQAGTALGADSGPGTPLKTPGKIASYGTPQGGSSVGGGSTPTLTAAYKTVPNPTRATPTNPKVRVPIGTGLTFLDVLLSPGSAGELTVRSLEVVAGGLLLALAILAFAVALMGKSVSPTALVAGFVPGGKVLAGVWSKG